MANPTNAVDDATLKTARMRALEVQTLVNVALREYLENAPAGGAQVEAKRDIVAASRESVSGSGREGHG